MDLALDGHGPLCMQVTRALKLAMANGRLPPGARLPASRELARALDLSRTTVVAAYERLRAEGYLAGKVGSGTYVAPSRRNPATATAAPRCAIPPQSAYGRRLRHVEGASSPFGRRLPGIRYSFAFSQPSVNPVLTSQWARELARAAPYVKPNYPRPEGLAELREAVCQHIGRTRGVVCTAENILITAGAQQAFSLLCDVLLDPGDEVVIEEPHYFNARAIFLMKGARLVPIDVDGEGLRTPDLPRSIPKLIYVTPSHQCPTGAVLSRTRRLELLEYAQRGDAWICEDDYDGEFRHEGRPVESLQSMDGGSRVIYVGSFSKTVFPSLRLGYLVVPAGLREDFVKAKWVSDFSCSPFEQSALAGLIANGGYDRHLRLTTRKLAQRRAVLRESLRECCGRRVEVTEAGSGMHLLAWLDGASRADGQAITRLAMERGLALFPVEHFYVTPPDRAGFLLGFSTMGPKDIREAVRLFAHCIDAVLPATWATRPAGRAGWS